MEAVIHTYLASFPTFVLVLIISVMLYILSKGADLLVDKAVSLSLHWGVPKMIIGATIVSLGTTLPEATVSVLAAINGNPDLALGNAIGSIIADTGLILGLAALIGRLPVDRVVVERQGKVQVWAGILLAVVSLPFFSGGNGNISRWVGWLFIVLLIIYIYSSIKWSKNPVLDGSSMEMETAFTVEEHILSEDILAEEKSPLIIQILELFAGIALVIGSSKILIPAVEISAVRVGIPQSIIAATLIAFGTSLPELVTAITAVRKGHGELAIGNIVGADILNVLFVVGSAAAVTSGGLDVPLNFYKLQIPTMLIILIAFRLFSKGDNEEITKKEGFILFLIYFVYLILNFTWL
ncbi:calcium/sodium antiporter [Geosporobacter ferrireducens]|uniref:Sodium:calcium antiporter n=1 Tax=Geosporobacter ferrireducens TaxID=1424294 RepID=A0A1D8GIB3_9FIRM|nr:calcium/sodium antiporter [Geosporobacter ferrireducens]AOT70638.1 sodium:calcium antiporter [Geosporobacter ferrireducens]